MAARTFANISGGVFITSITILVVAIPEGLPLAVTLALVALWWAASHAGWISRVFLPTPEATFASLREGLDGGELAQFTWATTWRMVEGWLLASLLGVLLGWACDGHFRSPAPPDRLPTVLTQGFPLRLRLPQGDELVVSTPPQRVLCSNAAWVDFATLP